MGWGLALNEFSCLRRLARDRHCLRQILEYAKWLGMDVEVDRDLLYIAREGLKAPLPEQWKPCKTTDTEEVRCAHDEPGVRRKYYL
jgi:hypothetical protein